VLNPAGGGTQEEVGKKPVAVRAHGHEIAAFFFNPLHDLLDGVAEGEFGFDGNIHGLKLRADRLEVGGIGGDLRTDCVGTVRPRRPAVGDVEQNDAAVGQAREFLDVFNDGTVGRSALERQQNRAVHRVEGPLLIRLESGAMPCVPIRASRRCPSK